MARPAADTEQVTLRTERPLLKRIEIAAKKMSEPGLHVGRTEMIRRLLVTGLKVVESK